MTNVVGLQTDDVGQVGQNSSAHVARVVGLQTDAVVVSEARFNQFLGPDNEHTICKNANKNSINLNEAS